MTSLKNALRRLTPGFLVAHYDRWQDYQALSPLAKQLARNDHGGDQAVDIGPVAAIEAMCQWLGVAQDQSASADGGFARHFNPSTGWAASYPETTGYIIPTLIDEAVAQARPELRDRALRALDWLCAIQFPEGGFQGGVIGEVPRVPVTFNTGQILMGLAAGVVAFDDARYRDATRRGAQWLVETQDADGCWRKHSTPFAAPGEKAYETHVAGGLLEAARVLPDQGFAESAFKQIAWALTKQAPNGWFADCCLSIPTRPLTHTIGYVLRGVLEGYRFSNDQHLLERAVLTASALLTCIDDRGRIVGRLDRNWQPAANYVCLTGSSQIAYCWLMLFEFTGEQKFLNAARRANGYVRRTLVSMGNLGTDGGVKGSHPIDGDYGTYEYLNWAAKFTIDAQRKELMLAAG